jgi:hypothetical protein
VSAALYTPETGVLTAARPTIAALAAAVVRGETGDREALDRELRAAGAGTVAAPHERLAEALEPLRRPIVGLHIGKTGYLMPAWVGEGRFTMHVFRDPAEDQLVSAPAEHLVPFLAWLLDLGPRSREPRPSELAVDGRVLDRAVALRLGGRPSAGLLPEPLDEAVAERFRDWWLATARWPAAPGAPESVAFEAIDTDDGLWSVQRGPDGPAVVRPVSPAATLFALGDLLPDRDLVDPAAERLAVEETPVRGGPLEWVADVLGEG